MLLSGDGNPGSAPEPVTDCPPAPARPDRASLDPQRSSVHRSKEDSVMATLTRWHNPGNAIDLFNELSRHFGSLLDESPRSFEYGFSWPRVTFADAGENFELSADVPGLTEKDVHVSIDQGVISIRGERKARNGEPALKLARSFTLPTDIDPDKITATVQHGVLTVVLPKAAAVKPRQIEVKAG
jgi:HSP20 family protein